VKVVLANADPRWPRLFRDQAAALREALGDRAERIDHIGSTSVPDLAAKPIIDIQVSVATFDPFEPIEVALRSLGYEWMQDNDDRRKRYFHLDADGTRLVNVHVRRIGEFSEQAALLFRDYLRANPGAAARYEAEKRRLAQREWVSIDDYADAKGDTIWALVREADVWSWHGWQPGRSDA
jgi:GrpB-like predicted nucleotidyltransferase (UPF0157 family)